MKKAVATEDMERQRWLASRRHGAYSPVVIRRRQQRKVAYMREAG